MKELDKIYTLTEVLTSTEEFPWDSTLFIDKNRNWHGQSRCAVIRIDIDEIDSDDEDAADNPEFARQHDLTYALNMADVQDIVINAKQQDPNVDEETLLKAFLYYHNNDAFMDLGRLYEL
jgi:hypothetical protein